MMLIIWRWWTRFASYSTATGQQIAMQKKRSKAGMAWLFDPKIFNYIIMSLYLVNTINWIYHGQMGQAWYWISAASITAAVTWGKFQWKHIQNQKHRRI